MTKTIGKKTSAETWLDSLDPATTPARDGRHLREIGWALTALEQAETDLHSRGGGRAGGRRLLGSHRARPGHLPAGRAPEIRSPNQTAPRSRRTSAPRRPHRAERY